MKTGLIILGNQLFDSHLLSDRSIERVYMREDYELCTYYKFHKLKIVFFLSAMRSHADELRKLGLQVDYQSLDTHASQSYDDALNSWLATHSFKKILIYEIEDKFFEKRLLKIFRDANIETEILPSPMFVTSREQFSSYLTKSRGKPFMRTFYEQQRKRLNVLIEPSGEPTGGKWSFDDQNRKPLPADVDPPKLRAKKASSHTLDVKKLCDIKFADHPGSVEKIWFATDRPHAIAMLDQFLRERFADFGAYEDAISERSVFVFHSALTPYLNTGLLTPQEVVTRALAVGKELKINIASIEGFIRQVIGWREFVRGVYQNFSDKQETTNFWKHNKKLSDHWYSGATGIPPLDNVIKKANEFAYAHHIERLMVVGNLMLLLEIEPAEAHRWFMEMFIDSSDWVMGPNVYGMGIFSDGGIFATKPYICGSNYYRKMGKLKTGDWCDGVDGLYWGFVDRHPDFFAKNPRLSMTLRTLEKMAPEKKTRIYAAADVLRARLTRS